MKTNQFDFENENEKKLIVCEIKDAVSCLFVRWEMNGKNPTSIAGI